ncbi:MAG: KamA family radical SAM protein [bacterium]|nr:KamA family radical SAM protein [bacterium]
MSKDSWKQILGCSIKSVKQLRDFSLTEEEKAFFDYTGDHDKLGFLVNSYYASLAEDKINDPVRRQFIPSVEEYTSKEYELGDPLGEGTYSPLPRLIHRYKDRVLLLVTDQCAMFCRHCFRRSFTGHDAGIISRDEMGRICDYLKINREINEILLSGGDPLTCSDGKIGEIIQSIRDVRPDMVIRLATRIPVVLPQRITDKLADILGNGAPIWIVTQFNHENEITKEAVSAIDKLVDKGIPILNQSVLLKGVNDNIDSLQSLFQKLVRLRVKPYYLFQGDLASGTSHFRVPLSRGRELMRELRVRISGLALPVYAVDMPDGGGKIPLTENYGISEDDNWYYFNNIEGDKYRYPKEK